MTKDVPPADHRRRRRLSAEEHALWHTVTKSTTPLKRGMRRTNKAEKDAAPTHEALLAEPNQSAGSAGARHQAAKRIEPSAPPPLALLSRREKSRLSRGRQEIDARIDLHGMTQTRAHRALLAFLRRAHADGAGFVLVITGKGRATAPESERGILRRQVPLWLALPEFRAVVVGFEEAHIGHGGGGALYVRIRRAR